MARKAKAAPQEDVGPVRYTQERLFWGIEEGMVKQLKALWKDAEQLEVSGLPDECLCVVIMMAAWARRGGIDLVDDYDALIQRARDAFEAGELHHPDLFFVSCVCILHRRDDVPSIGAFTQINIPEHYENLIGI